MDSTAFFLTRAELNATEIESNATEIESNATEIESNAMEIESNAMEIESNFIGMLLKIYQQTRREENKPTFSEAL